MNYVFSNIPFLLLSLSLPCFLYTAFIGSPSPAPPPSLPQVVLQVAITYIVDAFVMKLEQNNSEQEKHEVDNLDSIDGMCTHMNS